MLALFIFCVYCIHALYLVVYLYLRLAEQVQPYTAVEAFWKCIPINQFRYNYRQHYSSVSMGSYHVF